MRASLYGIDLVLPGDPRFLPTLFGQIPPNPNPSTGTYIVRSDTGLMEPATPEQLREYLEGGEYDEVSDDDLDDSEFESLEGE